MNDTLFKTAISAVLLGMDQEELDNLHPELFIMKTGQQLFLKTALTCSQSKNSCNFSFEKEYGQ
jgi:hypothetical protein